MNRKLRFTAILLAGVCVLNFSIIARAETISGTALSKDLNGDGVVDIMDVALAASAYNSKNTLYDVNGDSIVDLYDLVLISKGISSNYLDNYSISIGNTIGNLMNNSVAANDDGYIYYKNDNDGGKLYRKNRDETGKIKLSDNPVSSINVIGNKIFYTDCSDSNSIYSMNKDGTAKTKIVSGNTGNFIVEGGFIYYQCSQDANKLYKCNLDGTNNVKVIDDVIGRFAILGQYIYYTNKTDGSKLYRVKNDGSEKTAITAESVGFYCISNEMIYYASNMDNLLYRINIDGSNKQKISSEQIAQMNIVGDWIYFCSKTDGKLYKMKNDGTLKYKIGDESLNTSDGTGIINIIDTSIYYANASDGNKLYKINVDGTGKQFVDSFIMNTGFVTANPTLNVRSSPSTSASKLGTLNYLDKVQILDNSSGWYKIAYGTGTAYVYASYIQPINSSDDYLGILSAQYESNGDPGAISNTSGDPGGKSYGAWQLSVNAGSLNEFLSWLKNQNLNYYNRLITAEQADGNTNGTNFDNTWKQIASEDAFGFKQLQKAYIKYAYYDAGAKILVNKGFDISKKTNALKNVLWSTVVQHGVSGGTYIFNKVGLNLTEEQTITGVYDERSKVDIYFSSCSATVQQNLISRFASEKQDALTMLQKDF
ncbi:MAG: DUF5050 domain-containing protein [Bacillota bacterium]|nr:DUF5050 domain-containing protein [Bacillota bacterium]